MDAALANQMVNDLQNQVVHHKSEIRRHRQQLQWTAEKLAEFERQCAAAGIKIILNRKGEEGDLHGRSQNTP